MTSIISWTFGALSASILSTFSTHTLPARATFAASLDPRSEIYYPGSEQFINASIRWDASQTPTFDAIVKVTTEEDVQKTILYANANNRPFLAISGGHGTMSTISKLKNGIGILLRDMNNITIVDDGKAAIMQGGVLNGDVVPYLWSQGKQTTTTGCDCVGYIAPILGGGHGWLQGRYGLATDQLISARMVLANGTAITVSDEENKDLFWAIRGAGHNFGIVTEVKLRIYDREPEQDEWVASSFVFTHDKMEAVFSLANSWLDEPDRPVGLVHYGLFLHNPEIDPVNPIIIMWLYSQSHIPPHYTTALTSLHPLTTTSLTTPLQGVNTHIHASRSGTSCATGLARSLIPVSLHRYSLPALRTVLSIFTSLPPAYRSAVLMLEGYALHGVQAVPSEATAYPDREGRLLLSPVLTYESGKGLEGGAWEVGGRIRDALVKGNGGRLVAYVNYARGDERLEEVFGGEWRLERLRGLKREFDPEGRFNWFMPITV